MSNTTEQSDTPMETAVAAPPSAESTSSAGPAGQRLKRQQALVVMGRRVVAPPETSILLQDAAALLAETLEAEFGGAARFSADGRLLQLQLTAVQTGQRQQHTPTQEVSTAGAESLAGYVLEVARPVVVEDLSEDERFEDLFLRKHNVRSAIAVPLMLQDRSLGSLAAYTSQGRQFDEEDVLFAETLAHLVAATIARREAETLLENERGRVTGLLQTTDALVLKLDSQWRIIDANRACERLTGFSLREIRDRSAWNVFCVPEEEGTARFVLQRLREHQSPVKCESHLLTKHSERRQIAWSYSAACGEDGMLESIFASGIDVTELREVQDRASRAERAVRQARQELATLKTTGNTQTAENNAAPAPSPVPSSVPQTEEETDKGPDYAPTGAERRRQPRRSYPYTQKIAPIIQDKLPAPDAFENVQCNDIAAGGFSFLYQSPPTFEVFVVALGVPPRITYLTAQVRHVIRIEQDDQPMFVVGCKYMDRAEY